MIVLVTGLLFAYPRMNTSDLRATGFRCVFSFAQLTSPLIECMFVMADYIILLPKCQADFRFCKEIKGIIVILYKSGQKIFYKQQKNYCNRALFVL